MLEKVKAAISKFNMLQCGETVCCALSGGADSVALLLSLKNLSSELGITVTAVHVNHILRGKESDRDENFCRKLCQKLDIPLTVFRKDAAAFSHSLGVSVETGAREMRYEIFSQLSADKIATAHNLNDNAETVLFRMARGTGLRGLAGIPPVRGKIIRPLLFCTRDEIEAYLNGIGQDHVTDSTNLSDDYARNRIRHRIMPEMASVHEAFPKCITAMTASLAEDEDFLSKEALRRKDDDLRELHPAVGKRIIINLLQAHKLKISSDKISEIWHTVLNGGGKISLDGGFCAVCRKGRVKIFFAEKKGEPPKPTVIRGTGEYRFFGDKIVIITKETDENVNAEDIVNKNLTFNYADYDKILNGALLRNRLRSDRIKPVGSAHTRELRKLLQEKLPPEEREVAAVIADEKGVIWADHIGVDDRVKVSAGTKYF
ncbi:MAG: tRNA lysidine(34) synthetase TilS, partial [Oscillospiraceae bacterium]|nr:tRNA lysidine(34) synthetase TilS [Oscillospiraceae bacterium]